MDMRISENGILLIGRAGEWKEQGCPFTRGHLCRDLCPQFGEPVIRHDNGQLDEMEICQNRILQGLIDDLRGTNE